MNEFHNRNSLCEFLSNSSGIYFEIPRLLWSLMYSILCSCLFFCLVSNLSRHNQFTTDCVPFRAPIIPLIKIHIKAISFFPTKGSCIHHNEAVSCVDHSFDIDLFHLLFPWQRWICFAWRWWPFHSWRLEKTNSHWCEGRSSWLFNIWLSFRSGLHAFQEDVHLDCCNLSAYSEKKTQCRIVKVKWIKLCHTLYQQSFLLRNFWQNRGFSKVFSDCLK